MARAVAMGASGCLLKNASYREWCDTVRQVADGKNTWTRDELRRVNAVSSAPRSTDGTKIPLTRRETEVLRQLSHGLTNKEIAQASGISCETVKEHVQHILRKVGCGRPHPGGGVGGSQGACIGTIVTNKRRDG